MSRVTVVQVGLGTVGGEVISQIVANRERWQNVLGRDVRIGAVIGMIDLSKLFNKEVGFALSLIFLPFIFDPLLAFGNATYVGPPPPRLG